LITIVKMINVFFINIVFISFNLENYIQALYLDYYPNNQLSYELLILYKYYNDTIKIQLHQQKKFFLYIISLKTMIIIMLI